MGEIIFFLTFIPYYLDILHRSILSFVLDNFIFSWHNLLNPEKSLEIGVKMY